MEAALMYTKMQTILIAGFYAIIRGGYMLQDKLRGVFLTVRNK
jgi:hypothetical protein